MASVNDYGDDTGTLGSPPLGGPDGWAAAVAAALGNDDTPKVSRAGDHMSGALTIESPDSTDPGVKYYLRFIDGSDRRLMLRPSGAEPSLAVWNEDETELLPVRCADPSNPLHAATKDYVDGKGVWQSYTPAVSGLNNGSGTLLGEYCQIGELVALHVKLDLGTGFAFTGNVSVSLPVPAHPGTFQGQAMFTDQGFGYFPGMIRNTGSMQVLAFDRTSGRIMDLSASFPITWAQGDSIDITHTYRAATPLDRVRDALADRVQVDPRDV